MKRKIILISSIVGVVIIGVVITLCLLLGKNDSYQYPTKRPVVSNESETYITIGNYKLSKGQLYQKMLVTYGVNALTDMIDNELLEDTYEEDDYKEYYNKLVASTLGIEEEDLTDESFKTYENNMKVQGFYKAGSLDSAIRLDYRRFLYAKSCVLKEYQDSLEPNEDGTEKELYFTEAERDTAESSLYPDQADTIFINFRSQAEALSLLAKHGIAKDASNGFKYEDGTLLTDEQVVKLFVELYNEVNEYAGDSLSYVKDGDSFKVSVDSNSTGYAKVSYTYKELASVNSVIASKVFNSLSNDKFKDSYTWGPVKNSTRYYLAIKLSTHENDTAKVEEDIIDYLVENKVNSSKTAYYLYKLRDDAGLKIYDEGLEINYSSSAATAYSNVSVEYAGFEKTTEESDKYIATIKNGTETLEITADQVYNYLESHYGIQTAVTYMTAFIFLNDEYSKIYDFSNQVVLNQEKYDTIYANEVEAYRSELANGTFLSYGYDKNYGFENFIRDRYGFLDPKELIYVGQAYDEALSSYASSSWSFDTEEHIQKVFDEYFSVSSFTLSFFVDYNGDGLADEIKANDTIASGKKLVDYILDLAGTESAKVKGSTYYDRVNKLLSDYKVASFIDPLYGEYKAQGIYLSLGSKSSVSNSSTIDDSLKESYKQVYEKIRNGSNPDSVDVITENGQVVKFPYVSAYNTANTATTYTFGDYTPYVIDEYNTVDNAYYKGVVLSATNARYYTFTKEAQVLVPEEDTLDLLVKRYLAYEKAVSDRTDEEASLKALATYEKNYMSTYYATAKSSNESDEVIDEHLSNRAKEYINNKTFVFANDENNSTCLDLLDVLYE